MNHRHPGGAIARALAAVALASGCLLATSAPAAAVGPTAPLAAAAVAGASAASRPGAGASSPAARVIISRFDNAQMRVAITFDACATKKKGYGFDRAVYQTLQREKVPATIFTSGRWVELHPDVMTELAADPLVEFGNHSYDHPHMARLSAARITAQIDQTESALARFGKHSVAFRPPFGEFSARLIDVVRGRGLPAVLWDVVSGDPSKKTTVGGIIEAVTHQTRGGSIVIFHINGRGWKTAEALPMVVRGLRERGFELVPLSSLLGHAPAPAAAPAAISAPQLVPASPLGTAGGAVPPAPPFSTAGPVPCEVPPPGERVFPDTSPEPAAGAAGEEAWPP